MFEAVIHSTLQIIFRHKSLLKVFFIVLFNVFFVCIFLMYFRHH